MLEDELNDRWEKRQEEFRAAAIRAINHLRRVSIIWFALQYDQDAYLITSKQVVWYGPPGSHLGDQGERIGFDFGLNAYVRRYLISGLPFSGKIPERRA